MEAEFSNCTKDRRKEKYKWKQPKICDDSSANSFKLPKELDVPCRGCGKGQFMNSKNECEYCPSGFYQEIDNHKADSKKQIRSCKPCPAGTFAPRHKEINHFEEWP